MSVDIQTILVIRPPLGQAQSTGHVVMMVLQPFPTQVNTSKSGYYVPAKRFLDADVH